MRKKIKIILTVSILLNVLLAGIIASHTIKRAGHHTRHDIMIEEFSEHLPSEKKVIIQTHIQDVENNKRELFKAIRQARKDLVEVLVANQFDPTLYQEQADKLHKIHGKMGQEMINSIKLIAENLDVKERKKLAKKLFKFKPFNK